MLTSHELYPKLQRALGLPDRCVWMEMRLAVDEAVCIRCEYFPEGPAPKVQLSPEFKWCGDSFRREMNQWLTDRFGFKDDLETIFSEYELLERR